MQYRGIRATYNGCGRDPHGHCHSNSTVLVLNAMVVRR